LSDGWTLVQNEGWEAPLYWEREQGTWWRMTLHGMLPVDPNAPICHVSYYEADAYARFRGQRLPTEDEWELAASTVPIEGNLQESDDLVPMDAASSTYLPHMPRVEAPRQLYGDAWEWTQSAYLPYPGYRTSEGALGEYSGKFMCNQMVLRGGSFATPADHIRPSYRNFFYPQDRWQFSGIRLARDV
jgi:ergothioneine biosynthesis protein EgtB